MNGRDLLLAIPLSLSLSITSAFGMPPLAATNRESLPHSISRLRFGGTPSCAATHRDRKSSQEKKASQPSGPRIFTFAFAHGERRETLRATIYLNSNAIRCLGAAMRLAAYRVPECYERQAFIRVCRRVRHHHLCDVTRAENR